MKCVILAGGFGTRITEESKLKPKPMIEIGGQPILWHIMKYYSFFGINEFIICCGYKGYLIKEYFSNYFLHTSDMTIDLKENSFQIHKKKSENWIVTLVNTGEKTMTGGRLLAVSKYLKKEESFCFTYGDGLSDINITETISFHRNHGKLATVCSVTPPGRFGSLNIKNGVVVDFEEKALGDGKKVNGGFFVLSPKVIPLLTGEDCIFEQEPLQKLSKEGQLMAYTHNGFWKPMDTLRDKNQLEELWENNNAPWKKW